MKQRDEKAVVEVILKGQAATASLRDMEKAARAMRAELSKLNVNSDEFTKKAAEYNKMATKVSGVKNELKSTGKAFFDLNKMASSFVLANVLTAGLSRITGAFSKAVTTQRDFEKALQNLSAITGASGDDLKYYGNQAIKLGLNVEGGAKAVVEAFKLIGSAKPELLSSATAMNEVTEAAILLSQAAGMELPDAATRLTDAMNQFGAPASEAKKYVDALAAAAKYGAAEVPQVTEALLQFGTAAKSSNIDIYQSAAAIELLAEKGIKGAEAGTALRNVFAKMSAADVLPERASEMLAAAGVNIQILKDKTIPLSERLKELSKISGDAAAITKTFGLENKIAGEILISNLPRLAELTGQMRETGVASEQAAKNLDTFDQSLVRSTNAWDNLMLTMQKGWMGNLFKTMVDGWSASLETFASILDGTRNKAIDIQNIMILGNKAGMPISEGDAKKLANFGFDAGKTGELMDTSRMKLVLLLKETDKYVAVAKMASSTEKDRTAIMKTLQDQSDKLTASHKAGSLSTADYNVAMKIITAQMTEVMNAAKNQKIVVGKAVSETKYIDPDLVKKQKEAAIKHLNDLTEKIKAMERENSFHGLSEYEKNTKRIWAEHDEMLAKINEADFKNEDERAHAIYVLKQNTNNLLLDEEDKYLDELEKAKNDFHKRAEEATNSEYMNEINAVIEKYDALIEEAKKYNDSTVELEKTKQTKIADIRQREYEKSHPATKTPETDPNKTGGKNYSDEINQALNYYAAVESIGQAYAQAKRNERLQEQNEQDEMYNRALTREQRLYDQKVISKKEFEKRTAKLELEKQNRQRAFNQQEYRRTQQAARYNTIISGVEGIARIWATHAANPIVAGVLTGILATGTAVRLALIANEKPPQFAQGGATAPGGMVNQSTLFSSASGRNFIAGEAGSEWVAPNWMLQNPITANTIGMLEAVRQNRGFAKGGRTDGLDKDMYEGIGGAMRGFADNKIRGAAINNKVLVTMLEVLEYIKENGIDARISYDELQRVNKSIENARNVSKIG